MSFIKNIQLFFRRLQRHLLHLRLQPIRVFCLHHVTEVFDANSMYRADWMSASVFKQKVSDLLKNGVTFISLSEALLHIRNDKLRLKKYAVLTFDDGYKSLNEILPWLIENNFPVTLFINGKYLDSKSYRVSPNEKYLTQKELFSLTNPCVEIASHGWEHIDITDLSDEDFEKNENKNLEILSSHPHFVRFHAYTYGHSRSSISKILKKFDIIPVFIDGQKNYNKANLIHRELLK